MFNSSKIKSNFSYKVTIPDNFNFFYYINLLALVEVLAKLAKLVVVLKLELRKTSQNIKSLIFLNICTLPQHALTRIIL